ncbi:MAG: endonuclease/exonuclease/phosphatase family protein [Prolixibacteraceae bacterium]|nr:endonuclease/exonuclease/phosphatase family protein [Prolixibacteraceae bacterium]
MCYNIRYGELASIEELAGFIKSLDPDIVALQEVDVKTNRPGVNHQHGKDFITELGYHTGMLTAYGRTINHAGGYYGIGILSKYPFSQTKRVLLPMPPGAREQRAFLTADVELPCEQKITFVSTHLDHSTSEVRQAQVKYLNKILLKNPFPVIIAGDFNARPDSHEISRGMARWKRTCNQDYTSPAKNPGSKIDYIFCYPEAKWEVKRTFTKVINLSDHLPVFSELKLID